MFLIFLCFVRHENDENTNSPSTQTHTHTYTHVGRPINQQTSQRYIHEQQLFVPVGGGHKFAAESILVYCRFPYSALEVAEEWHRDTPDEEFCATKKSPDDMSCLNHSTKTYSLTQSHKRTHTPIHRVTYRESRSPSHTHSLSHARPHTTTHVHRGKESARGGEKGKYKRRDRWGKSLSEKYHGKKLPETFFQPLYFLMQLRRECRVSYLKVLFL